MKSCRAPALLVILVTLAAVALPGTAQTSEGEVATELRQLNRSVADLVTLVSRLIEQNRDDLLLRRLEIKVRQIEPLQRELRNKLEQLPDMERHLEQQETEVENIRRNLFDAEAGVSDVEGFTAEQLTQQFKEQLGYSERAFEDSQDRVRLVQYRIGELENLLAPLRTQIATLEQALESERR